MRVGIPRERKDLERRVALTPDGAVELVRRGHEVVVETGAGEGSAYPDAAYEAAGCRVAATLAEVWETAGLLVKVKEPAPEEFPLFREDLVLFDYLHLASLPDVAAALVAARTTALSYELVRLPDGRLPLLEPMSEVAGKLAVVNGAAYLLAQNGGRGILLGGAVGVPPGEVVVLGAGVAGRAACETAVGLGASVTVFDLDSAKLERARTASGGRVKTCHPTRAAIDRACAAADLVVGAVLVPGAAAPKVLVRETIRGMKRGAVFVDVSIDQGGCAETIRATTLSDPVYVEEGVIHYGVCNMPAQTPRTSTEALTAATLPYVLALADHGRDAFTPASAAADPRLVAAVTTSAGRIVNEAVAASLGAGR